MRHDTVASEAHNDEAFPQPVPEEAVRGVLDEILASADFRASKRCKDFLKFVVEQTLSGRAGHLKERTIGVEVFGRAAAYDTNDDGVVRIKASEVRRRLGNFYAGPGKHSSVRIELPVGGYTPHFSWKQEPVALSAAATSLEAELSNILPERSLGKSSARGDFRRWIAVSITITCVALAIALLVSRRSAGVLDQFWAPVVQRDTPVLVAAAYVPVYEKEQLPTGELQQGPGSAVIQAADSEQPQASQGIPSRKNEFLLLPDQYVGGGDLVATARVAGMLSRMRRPYVVKVGSVAFEDMRNAPTILIGYSSDRWAAVSKRLRFYIDDERGFISDDGKPTSWYPHNLTREFHTDEDYAIISRVFDSQTHAMLVEVTGCTQYGTEAAAEVVTDPELMAEALRGAPRGWQRKNLQLVLHMNVISNYPATPKVIASYYW